MAEISYCVTVCPFCGEEIKRGFHRFGPRQVICCHCSNMLDTGLTPWDELPSGKKFYLIISELLVPSWECTGKALLGNVLIWYFVANVIGFVLYYKFGNDPVQIMIDVIFSGIMALILVPGLRLIAMIYESNKFSRENKIPVWRKSYFYKGNR